MAIYTAYTTYIVFNCANESEAEDLYTAYHNYGDMTCPLCGENLMSPECPHLVDDDPGVEHIWEVA